MVKIIFFANVILITVVAYFTQKTKSKMCMCKSFDITATGLKRYKEDPVAVQSSPNSYHQLEYICNKCGNIFWVPKQSSNFN